MVDCFCQSGCIGGQDLKPADLSILVLVGCCTFSFHFCCACNDLNVLPVIKLKLPRLRCNKPSSSWAIFKRRCHMVPLDHCWQDWVVLINGLTGLMENLEETRFFIPKCQAFLQTSLSTDSLKYLMTIGVYRGITMHWNGKHFMKWSKTECRVVWLLIYHVSRSQLFPVILFW